MCGIYETRPAICREYKAKDCDYACGDYGYDAFFTTPEQVVEYADALFAKKARKKKPSKPKARSGGKAKKGVTFLNRRAGAKTTRQSGPGG
jgi:Fe-S-cluster containining protein